jgi:hypothetical protein
VDGFKKARLAGTVWAEEVVPGGTELEVHLGQAPDRPNADALERHLGPPVVKEARF